MTRPDRKTKVKAGPIVADRLKSFIERIERLETERQAIGGDIRDVYSEAKGVGYDVKTMRKIVQLRKIEVAERDEQEQILDLYAHALGMVVGSADTSGIGHNSPRGPTEDELMDKAAKVLSEVDRCMLLPRDPLPAIRAIMDDIGCSAGKAHKLRKLVEQRLDSPVSRSNVETVKTENEITQSAVPETPPGEGTGTTAASGPGSALASNEDAAPAACVDGGSVSSVAEPIVPRSCPPQTDEGPALSVTPAPDEGVGTGTYSDDPGPMPAFLRRERVSA